MSSLYLHIPYCRSKCDYCDFYSQVGDAVQLAEYLELLLCDLQLLRQDYPDQGPLQTIFFGGGTPSLLSAAQVARLLGQLDADFGIATGCEISLEGNPGTLSRGKLQGYAAAGVNRLSLGVQSLCDHQLRQLGRGHSAAEAREAVALAREAGITNLNLDLIFALPGQGEAELQEDLRQLLALQPEHVSLYGLSFEPGTRLSERLQRGELEEPAEAAYADQFCLLHEQLTAAGLEHYEISNFARPGYRCAHNQVYWRRQECLAAGCGAHGFAAPGWGERWELPADLAGYRKALQAGVRPVRLLERFDRRQAMAETIYLALRTADGLQREEFHRTFGEYPEGAFPQAFRRLEGQLQRLGQSWRFGLQAWLLYDHLIAEFLIS